jgi:hypothetical protein
MSQANPRNPSFLDVKAVLDKIIADWTAGNGGPPDLIGNHGPTFMWNTSAQLKAAVARGQPLIQPNIIGQAGLGKTANLVIDLTTGGVNGFPAMPFGGLDSMNGLYLNINSSQIQTIIAWIESGCPG